MCILITEKCDLGVAFFNPKIGDLKKKKNQRKLGILLIIPTGRNLYTHVHTQ